MNTLENLINKIKQAQKMEIIMNQSNCDKILEISPSFTLINYEKAYPYWTYRS